MIKKRHWEVSAKLRSAKTAGGIGGALYWSRWGRKTGSKKTQTAEEEEGTGGWGDVVKPSSSSLR